MPTFEPFTHFYYMQESLGWRAIDWDRLGNQGKGYESLLLYLLSKSNMEIEE